MLRPATLFFRALSAPARQLRPQSAPAEAARRPARRWLATAPSAPSTPSDPPAPTPTPKPTPTPAPSPAPAPAAARPAFPFHVSRTAGNNLAVYQRSQRGGNRKLTLVKKAEGDLAALRTALAEGLQLADDDVKINQRTRHIVVEGHRANEVKSWLAKQGF